jgi:antitoxin (DNA-binding transcriptional repressor) of toxin-antitoxin stability system
MHTSVYNAAMATMSITEFRRRCLTLLDALPREGLVVTKRGRPVARVERIRRDPRERIGSCPDLRTDPNDNLFSTGMKWDAES